MDQRLPEFVAVITPARTDIFPTRQSGDTRDKKETIAQALSLIADGDIAESNVTQHVGALNHGSLLNVPVTIDQAEAEAGTATTDRLFTAERVAQAIAALASGADITAIAAGSAAAPSLAWGDGDTGFYELSDGIINFTSQGVGVWSFRTGAILPFNAAGPAMLNEAATSINPTFAPNAADLDTGLGWNAADELSLVAGSIAGLILKELNSGVIQAPVATAGITANSGGGQGGAVALINSYNVIGTCAATGDSVKLPAVFNINSIIYVKNDGAESCNVFPAASDNLGEGTNLALAVASGESATFIATTANATWTQLIKPAIGAGQDPLLLGSGTENDPSFSFAADPDTGIFLGNTAVIHITAAGTAHFEFNNATFGALVANGPRVLDEAATATNPTLVPSKADTDTGLGWPGTDQLSLVAGSLDCINISEVSSARRIGFYVTAPIALQTGVAVTAAGVHAAMVNLGLITA